MKRIGFESDEVKVKTGHRVDGSAYVTFIIGEYQLENIKELATVWNRVMHVTVVVKD